jgi:anti-sigma regulatory factor (Ser/Thr protein kinase)
MSFTPREEEIQEILNRLTAFGLSGYVTDFIGWIKMDYIQKGISELDINKEFLEKILDSIVSSGGLIKNKSNEYSHSKTLVSPSNWNSDQYEILGAFEYSPIQYVRTRLEYFLISNEVNEDDLMDISIATIEGIENAVKYGDGNQVAISTKIIGKKLELSIINNIKEFDLKNEIDRGKYSVNATLMRGVMVMQKLFNHLDIEIIDEKKQARLYAEKILS